LQIKADRAGFALWQRERKENSGFYWICSIKERFNDLQRLAGDRFPN